MHSKHHPYMAATHETPVRTILVYHPVCSQWYVSESLRSAAVNTVQYAKAVSYSSLVVYYDRSLCTPMSSLAY